MIVVTPEAGESLWQFLRAAHAAIGMRSIGLVEAALLGSTGDLVPARRRRFRTLDGGAPGADAPARLRHGRRRLVPRGGARAARARDGPDVSAARDGAVDRVLGMALTRTS